MNNDSQHSPSSPFALPGAGNLQSIMESMQKAWGFAAVPSVAPAMDIEEIDRRLEDLNTVSQWLALNQNMLQSSIQALQVQRATLSTIKSFGLMPGDQNPDGSGVSPLEMMQAFTNAFAAAPTPAEAPAAPPPAEPAASGNESTASDGLGPQQWWDMLQKQFAQVASTATTPEFAGQAAGEPAEAAPAPEPQASPAAAEVKPNPPVRSKPAKPRSPKKAGPTP